MTESSDEKTLQLLLRAEFAEFKIALFNELQAKLDAKADRLPFELVTRDVAELKARAEGRKHIEQDVKDLQESQRGIERMLLVQHEQRRGARGVLNWARRTGGWLIAFGLALTDLLLRTLK